jgi:hypothetical protein
VGHAVSVVVRVAALAAALLLTHCAGPRVVTQHDGFRIEVYRTRAAVQARCDDFDGRVNLPRGGCYVPAEDLAIIEEGDGTGTRHEVCHHVTLKHRGWDAQLSEWYCSERWHYRDD